MPPTIIVKLHMNEKEEIGEKKKEVILNTDILNETNTNYKYFLKRAKDIRLVN
jgi:hypothetical protein